MHREVFITEDGSHSISIPALNASYHSTHGALQESRHIFIETGLKPLLERRDKLSVLELGLGTGLNVLLTLTETENWPLNVYYEAIEPYPVALEMAAQLNFPELIEGDSIRSKFLRIHQLPWDSPQQLSENFILHKRQADIRDTTFHTGFDLIYFDAFAPDVQPELWATALFTRLYETLKKGGILVTYCSKSIVRRSMAEAGFLVEKLPGPPGKREIVRAGKND